jgi:hypothetical protein
MVAKTESSEALNIHKPDIPAPVPASTMALAPKAEAIKARCEPTLGVTHSIPNSSALARASIMAGDSETKSSVNFQLDILSTMISPNLKA